MRKRILYVDALKVFACFQVVLLHSFHLEDMTKYSSDIFHNFLSNMQFIMYAGVPIFFAISGITLIRNESESLYLKRIFIKILKIITYLIVFQFPFFIFRVYIKHDNITFFEFIKRCFMLSSIEGANWFWYPYAGLLVMSPIISAIFLKINKIDLYIFYFILLLQNFIPKIFPEIAKYFPYIFNNDILKFNYIFLLVITGFIINNIKNMYKFVLLIMVVYLIISKIFLDSLMYDYILVCSYLYLFKFLDNSFILLKREQIIHTISDLTLGIYMIHMYIYNIIRRLYLHFFNVDEIHNAYVCYLIAIITFAICCNIIYVMKKNRLIKLWLS